MKRVDILPNLLSLGNMYCGLAAVFTLGATSEPSQEQIVRASWLIILAILFDTFDGRVARLTNSVSEFGKQLDSMSDLVSFGIAPGFLVFKQVMQLDMRAATLLAVFFITTTGLRLARFNIGRASLGGHFIGLPAPAAG